MPPRQKPSSSQVVLQVSPRAAKVLVATIAPFQVQRVNASTLPEQTEDPVAALRALLDVQPLNARQVGLLFGREAFSLRTLELPSSHPKEIASMLELQLGKLTPYPRSDILFGWTTIGSFREGYTSVLLAIARKALIEGVLQLLKTKGVQPLWVGVSTEGLESWGALQPAPKAPPGPSTDLTALIDVDFASTDCAILSRGRLLFTHSIPLGADQLASSDQAKLRWVGELVRLPRILLHEEIRGRIGRGVITGVTRDMEPIVEQLTSQWGVSVEVVEVLAAFAPTPAVTQSVQTTRCSYAALAGVLGSGKPPRIDLIPPEARVTHDLQVRSKHLARFVVSSFVLLCLVGLLYFERIWILSHYLTQVTQRVTVVEQVSRQIVQRQDTMRRIHAWMDPSHSALHVFNALAAAVDPSITITAVAYEEQQPVTIRGRAGTGTAAYAFFDRLKQQGGFANVQARSVTTKKGGDAAEADFEIVCELPRAS